MRTVHLLGHTLTPLIVLSACDSKLPCQARLMHGVFLISTRASHYVASLHHLEADHASVVRDRLFMCSAAQSLASSARHDFC